MLGRQTAPSLWQAHQLGGSCPGLANTAHLPAHHRQRQARLAVEARCKPAGMGVWATKAGMTQIFTPEGLALPATVLALEEGNIVTQVLLAQHLVMCYPANIDHFTMSFWLVYGRVGGARKHLCAPCR